MAFPGAVSAQCPAGRERGLGESSSFDLYVCFATPCGLTLSWLRVLLQLSYMKIQIPCRNLLSKNADQDCVTVSSQCSVDGGAQS